MSNPYERTKQHQNSEQERRPLIHDSIRDEIVLRQEDDIHALKEAMRILLRQNQEHLQQVQPPPPYHYQHPNVGGFYNAPPQRDAVSAHANHFYPNETFPLPHPGMHHHGHGARYGAGTIQYAPPLSAAAAVNNTHPYSNSEYDARLSPIFRQGHGTVQYAPGPSATHNHPSNAHHHTLLQL